MNSRSSVNERNLVNFSSDLTTFDQLDTKESLLSFPFDHIYACSESTDRRRIIQLDKEVEITTHCGVPENRSLLSRKNLEITRLADKLSSTEIQNKKLKDLLVYHLDLIQQQNELMSKKEKLFQALKEENDTLKNRVKLMEGNAHKESTNTSPLAHVPSPPVTSTVVKSEPGSQRFFNSFTELLMPDTRTTSSYLFDSDLTKPKPFGQSSFDLTKTTEADLANFMSGDLPGPSLLDTNIGCEDFTMIESKRSFIKKEMKVEETRPEPLYTITSNSGNPVIQKIQRNKKKSSTGIGALSRMSRNTVSKTQTSETNKKSNNSKSSTFKETKSSKNIYGKSRNNSNPKRISNYTGSLSDRLQLIDTTPTGEDPYQLGEADMREQSPIPKLMLQKSHGRLKIYSEPIPETTTSSKRVYEPTVKKTTTKRASKAKEDSFHLSSTYLDCTDTVKNQPKTLIVHEPDLDLVKTETEIDWRIYSPNDRGNDSSLCDFSFEENTSNLTSQLMPGLEDITFQDLFSTDSPLNLDNLNDVDFNPPPEKPAVIKNKKRKARTTSLVAPSTAGEETKRGVGSKRGRKRATSTTGSTRAGKAQKTTGTKKKTNKPKAPSRGKKSPVPTLMTDEPYPTLIGDPDLSWYVYLDPDVKPENVDPPEAEKQATVEVPRWREKPYTSSHTMAGTEDLDDKVFQKRHQKFEAEERRQLRWHMRRIREQKHVERLRQRQKDSWCSGSGSSANQPPASYTIWPQPVRDAQYIEITDTLPVLAFGNELPCLPGKGFTLPWVRTPKPLKRAKRSKTLH